MLKKGKVNKVEQFYIEQNHAKLTVEEIAEDLNRAVPTVKKFIKGLQVVAESKESDDVIDKATPVKLPPEKGSVKPLLARREGITIMTEAASAESDKHRDVVSQTIPIVASRYRNCIYRQPK